MSPPERRSSLGVIFLTVFVDLIGFSIIFPLFPAMLDYYLEREGADSLIGDTYAALSKLAGAEGDQGAFYATVLFGGLLGSLYSILQFLFAPFWGALSDKTGRRPVLLMTIAGLAVSYLIWIFSGSFVLLILSRLLGGVMGGNISVATAAIADSTDAKSRAKGMGIIGAAFGLGFILGPAIGGGLSTVDLSDIGVPGLNPFSAAALGAFLLSAWNLVWVTMRFGETLPESARGQATAARRPINPLKLFRGFDVPGVTLTNLIYFVFLVAFAGMEFTLTFLAKDRFGYTAAENAWIFVYVGLIIAVIQGGVVRRLAPRLGEKRLSIFGLALIVPGLVVTGQAGSEVLLYVGLGLLAVGSALATPCLTSLVSLYAPNDRQGEILGTFRSLGALSRAVGPILACLVYWRFGSEWPYWGSAAALLVPIALAFGLPAVRSSEGDEPDASA